MIDPTKEIRDIGGFYMEDSILLKLAGECLELTEKGKFDKVIHFKKSMRTRIAGYQAYKQVKLNK